MERQEKIDAIIEFLDDNHIEIIDTTSIGAVIVNTEQCLDKTENKYEYDELLEKGLTDNDIGSFKKFLEHNTLMMIKTEEISGVSFENCEYDADELYNTKLLSDVEENVEEDENENDQD